MWWEFSVEVIIVYHHMYRHFLKAEGADILKSYHYLKDVVRGNCSFAEMLGYLKFIHVINSFPMISVLFFPTECEFFFSHFLYLKILCHAPTSQPQVILYHFPWFIAIMSLCTKYSILECYFLLSFPVTSFPRR